MKKYIISLMLVIISQTLVAQISFNSNDSIKFIKSKHALDTVIEQSLYIVEAVGLTHDYYYLIEDDQSYWRTMMKVSKVIRGSNIFVGDTIVSIWKGDVHGKGRENYPRYSITAPRLWYAAKSTSCIFLTDSKFPVEPIPDQWSQFEKMTFINSSIGYFAACYDSHVGGISRVVPVFIKGLMFNNRYEWYDYLRNFSDINLPKE